MKTVYELKKYINTIKDAPKDYKVAVGSLIFKDDDSVILIERGSEARDEVGKLEGIGGGIDGEENLHEALFREIKEELGDDIKIKIDNLLTVIILPGEKYPFWVVPIYLCKLVTGTPKIMEPNKCSAIHTLRIKEIDTKRLSRFQSETMRTYSQKYGTEPYYKT